jgi:hypothetical protein
VPGFATAAMFRAIGPTEAAAGPSAIRFVIAAVTAPPAPLHRARPPPVDFLLIIAPVHHARQEIRYGPGYRDDSNSESNTGELLDQVLLSDPTEKHQQEDHDGTGPAS